MTFIDFFAGIGGIRAAMEAAGHRCVGFIEVDRFAVTAYRAIHNTEGEFFAPDIRTIDPAELPDADLYTFGFPCQAFSIGGRRLGFEDTRGTLIHEVLRLAATRKPRYLFAENVAGLLSHDRGQTFRIILDAMGELGYFCEWQLIHSDAYIPQSRPRVYIVGHYGTPPARTVFPVVPADAEPRLILAGDLNIKGLFKSANRVYSPDGISPCLDTSSDRPHILMPDGRVRRLTALEKWRLQGFSDDAYYKAAEVCSDSQLQKQAGNSVSVPVIYEIAKRLKELEE